MYKDPTVARVVSSFPHPIREIVHCWIPMRDGIRISARIWLPKDAERSPVPAILECHPYRKQDAEAWQDAINHPYFAGHGYASVRIDLRGSGESEGILQDEYSDIEHDDICEVIAWLAAQPWCTGSVGMIGISWGGFTALQVAARRPPALKCIITCCSTDDRYADDMHYMGGSLMNDNMVWGAHFFLFMSRPPTPDIVGNQWREMWIERLHALEPFVAQWLKHQRRNAYWKRGSVCENYGDIACPVYTVSGWADGYRNAVFRLLANLNVPRKGLIGPWSHMYGHQGVPGPAIGFLQECLRWWDHWLKGKATGIMDEPMLRAYMLEPVRTSATLIHSEGRWIAESSWPSPSGTTRVYHLGLPGTLTLEPGRPGSIGVSSPPITGLASGVWGADRHRLDRVNPGAPLDQREDDANSLCFETEPLHERIEIFGAVVAKLNLSVDRPVAQLAVRLCDVAPDGASTRITYGVLNLTHVDGHEFANELKVGQQYRARVQLTDVARAIPVGNRLRLSISTAYWPLLWPSPARVTATIHCGHSCLELPLRASRDDDAALVPFDIPETAPPLSMTLLRPGKNARTIHRDVGTGETIVTCINDDGLYRIERTGVELDFSGVERYRLTADDPLSATSELDWTCSFAKGDWYVRCVTHTRVSGDANNFHLTVNLDAYEGDTRVFCRSWNQAIPRDMN